MRTVNSLGVTVTYHADGCVVLEGHAATKDGAADLYEHYDVSAAAADILRAVARWVDSIERGDLGSETLWTELQLPYPSPAERT